MEKLFNKTQEVREIAIANGVHISFACYKEEDGSGVTFFNNTTPILNVSVLDDRTPKELYLDFLAVVRNKLNRKITTLKKANLKQ